MLCAILMVISYGFAQTWTPLNVTSYGGTALSADGRIILSVGSTARFISTNRGVTWGNVGNSRYYFGGVTSSADGTKLVALPLSGGFLSLSADAGITWTTNGSSSHSWTSCASSADGIRLVAAAYLGLIYTSTNFGATWQTNNAPSNYWQLASCADGTKLAAAANGDKIYISTNSGLTWSATSAPINSWHGISSSSDGSHLIVGSDKGVYISTNSGFSWTSNILGQAVASSADGSKLIVAYSDSSNHGYVYTSTNFGISWITNALSNRKWSEVRSSADGSELLACAYDYPYANSLWLYHSTPSPQLQLVSSDTNIALSWLVSSTNFALQQNLDLATTNWVTLTNTPTLNFANLNSELILPPSDSSGFFRLMTQ